MLDKIKSNGGILGMIVSRIIKKSIRKQYGIDICVEFSDIDIEYDGGLVKLNASLYGEMKAKDAMDLIKEI